MMKSIINHTILLFLTSVIVLVGINSCDVNHSLDTNKYAKIYMPQARDYPAERSVLINADTTQTIVYGAAYGGPSKPSRDIAIDFSVNPSLVDSFNTNNLTSYSILPSNSYELTQTKATIPAGEISTPAFKINLKTQGTIQGGGTKYLLPVGINKKKGGIKINKDLQIAYFLIQGSYVEYDRTFWRVIGVDSGFPADDPVASASKMFDGNINTMWHTEWKPNQPPPPHYISIDMGESYNLNGFRIIGREGQKRGNPKNIDVLFSNNGEDWSQRESFTLPLDDTKFKTKIYFSEPHDARYFKIIVNSNVDDAYFTHINELYAF